MKNLNKLILSTLLLGLAFIQGASSSSGALAEAETPLTTVQAQGLSVLNSLQELYLTPEKICRVFGLPVPEVKTPDLPENLQIVQLATLGGDTPLIYNNPVTYDQKGDEINLFLVNGLNKTLLGQINLFKPTKITSEGKIVYALINKANILGDGYNPLSIINLVLQENVDPENEENKNGYILNFIHRGSEATGRDRAGGEYQSVTGSEKGIPGEILKQNREELLKAGIISLWAAKKTGNDFIDRCQNELPYYSRLSSFMESDSGGAYLIEKFEQLRSRANSLEGKIVEFGDVVNLRDKSMLDSKVKENLLKQLILLLALDPNFDLTRIKDPDSLKEEEFEKYVQIKTEIIRVLEENKEKLFELNEMIYRINTNDDEIKKLKLKYKKRRSQIPQKDIKDASEEDQQELKEILKQIKIKDREKA